VTTDFVVSFVEVCLDGFKDLGELAAVSAFNRSEGDTGASFSSNESSQTSFSFDNAIWNSHFTTQCWDEKNQLKGINIMGDDDQLSFLLFNSSHDGVSSLLQRNNSFGWGVSFTLCLILSTSLQPCLPRSTTFWSVLIQHTEQLLGCLSVQSLVELIDWWRNLESLLKDSLLPLDADVSWPFDESAEVAGGLDILSYAEVTCALLEKRILLLFRLGLLRSNECGRRCYFLPHDLLLPRTGQGRD